MAWGDTSDCDNGQDMEYQEVRYNKRKKRADWVMDLIVSKQLIK